MIVPTEELGLDQLTLIVHNTQREGKNTKKTSFMIEARFKTKLRGG